MNDLQALASRTQGRHFVRAYRYALDPTPDQQAEFRSHCGAQRYAYNWGLNLVKANLAQREAERTYGLAETDLTPLLDWSAFALRKVWNRAKDEAAPWWRENSKEAYASGLANLADALRNWAKSWAGDRNGPIVGFPRFKTKKSRMACRFTTGCLGLTEMDRRHVKLPRIGTVRTHESTRKLARRLAAGSARIRTATVSFARGRWFVSFSVEVDGLPTPQPPDPRAIVGVDLGIRSLAVLSTPVVGISDTSGVVRNPAFAERARKKLRRLQRRASRRRGPDRRFAIVPSSRWRRAQAKVDRLHARICNARADESHKLTSALSRRFGVIVVEDLNVAGMLRNRRLSRQISDANWAEVRRQLAYKANLRGGRLIVANRFYASSKTCSGCGAVKATLRLSERIYQCESCGLTMDRDRNAACNLAGLADWESSSTSSSSCGATQNEPDGNPQKARDLAGGIATGSPGRGNAA